MGGDAGGAQFGFAQQQVFVARTDDEGDLGVGVCRLQFAGQKDERGDAVAAADQDVGRAGPGVGREEMTTERADKVQEFAGAFAGHVAGDGADDGVEQADFALVAVYGVEAEGTSQERVMAFVGEAGVDEVAGAGFGGDAGGDAGHDVVVFDDLLVGEDARECLVWHQ